MRTQLEPKGNWPDFFSMPKTKLPRVIMKIIHYKVGFPMGFIFLNLQYLPILLE